MAEFKGFDHKFFAFFKELADNNNREWFEANKARYDNDVAVPLLAFIEAMQPHLAKITPHFVANPRKTGGSMFRVYRDVRFSKDKRPYKTHGACQFRHELGKDAHAPGFYVHLEPGQIFFGGGIWMPPSDTLKRIRDGIAEDQASWKKATKGKKISELFGEIHGDALSRPPKGFAADHPMIEDIKRKSFFLMRKASPSLAAKPGFVEETAKTFKAASPLMRFLCDAAGVDF